MRDALDLVVARIHRRRRSGLAGLSPSAGGDPAAISAAGWARLGLLSSPEMPVCSVLTLAAAVPPSFCPQLKTLLVCDGSSIMLRSFASTRGSVSAADTLLPAPGAAGLPAQTVETSFGATFTITGIGAVTQACISPSGLFVAAVVDVTVLLAAKKEERGDDAAAEGHHDDFDGLYGDDDDGAAAAGPQSSQPSKEVYVWFHDLTSPEGDWVCLGGMGVPLLAAESAVKSENSTGFISCAGQPGGG